MPAIQIRSVSDSAHSRLKQRARDRGQSLSEYLRLELEQMAATPTIEEMVELVATRDPAVGGESAADSIRAGREEREQHLADIGRDKRP